MFHHALPCRLAPISPWAFTSFANTVSRLVVEPGCPSGPLTELCHALAAETYMTLIEVTLPAGLKLGAPQGYRALSCP